MTKLKQLQLSANHAITDDSIKLLTGLKTLYLSFNDRITNCAINGLLLLKSLSLRNNDVIKDISKLINLRSLDLNHNTVITRINDLTKLTCLNLSFNRTINDNELNKLTNLISLQLKGSNIRDNGISSLRKLKIITLNDYITGSCLTKLTTLEHIFVSRNSIISVEHLCLLPNLKIVDIHHNSSFDTSSLLLANSKIVIKK